jgi:hypothetical protein
LKGKRQKGQVLYMGRCLLLEVEIGASASRDESRGRKKGKTERDKAIL